MTASQKANQKGRQRAALLDYGTVAPMAHSKAQWLVAGKVALLAELTAVPLVPQSVGQRAHQKAGQTALQMGSWLAAPMAHWMVLLTAD